MKLTLIKSIVLHLLIFACFYAGASVRAAEKPLPFKVEVTGSGRPMILIPGLACSGEVWQSTVAHFKSNYQCHVLTLAGFAGEAPVAPPFLDTMRDGIIAYIHEKKLAKPVIVGHSLGGVVTLAIAAKEPALVGPLVIVDSLPFFGAIQDPNATEASVKPQAEAMRKTFESMTDEQYSQGQKAFMQTMVSDESNIALVLKWGAATDRKTFAQAYYEIFTTDLRAQIAAIKSPALVIASWIGLKPYVTREQVESNFKSQYAKLANYRLVVNDKAKHFVMLDDPAGFFAAADDFLKTADAVK
jgi:pimeloyl-ACP methyl ester carboxylesterase